MVEALEPVASPGQHFYLKVFSNFKRRRRKMTIYVPKNTNHSTHPTELNHRTIDLVRQFHFLPKKEAMPRIP